VKFTLLYSQNYEGPENPLVGDFYLLSLDARRTFCLWFQTNGWYGPLTAWVELL
jgi:hypothetical protein